LGLAILEHVAQVCRDLHALLAVWAQDVLSVAWVSSLGEGRHSASQDDPDQVTVIWPKGQ
jgi:hypothetical protein